MCKSKMLIEHDHFVYLTNKYGKTKIFYQTTPEHLMIIHGHKKRQKKHLKQGPHSSLRGNNKHIK